MNQKDLQEWFRINGDTNLRIDYPLNENSIVFDLGGYHGTWSQKIVDKYNPNVHIFEPIPSLYENLVNQFKNNNKVKVYNFGFSDKEREIEISFLEDASSFYLNSENKILSKVFSLVDFIKENNFKYIDLIKINIEGDEFPLLNNLIENDMVNVFGNIQVQFHQFIQDSINKRNLIREKLSVSHELTYDYEFVWENWKKK